MKRVDKQEPPDRYRLIGALMMVNGMINMTMGWFIAMYVWGICGSMCTGLITLGMCPFGVVCAFVPILILPLAMMELVTGILIIASPEQSRPMMSWLPWVQIGAIFLGDVLSPIVGLVCYMSMQDPEVIGYLEDHHR